MKKKIILGVPTWKMVGKPKTQKSPHITNICTKWLYKHPLGKQATVTDIILYAVFYLYTMTDVTFYFHEVYTAPPTIVCSGYMRCTFQNPRLNMNSEQCVSLSQ